MSDFIDVPEALLAVVRTLATGLPETSEERAWTGVRWVVRRKNFAHVFTMVDPGGQERTMLQLRADPEEREVLLAVGHPFFDAGWGERLGVLLDETTDWAEIGELLTESYCIQAPRKLVARLDLPSL